MSENEHSPGDGSSGEEESAHDPNLKLIYGLIALALFAAIVFAALIVLPFYHRR